MARVHHLREWPDENGKTLCGRETTFRYKFVNLEQVVDGLPDFITLCSRCQSKAERLGMIPRRAPVVSPDGDVDFNVPSGDKVHDDWLSRLGIG